jgi:hypothetical protein
VLRTSYGASKKKENFCLPRSILSEAKDCYGARLLCPPKAGCAVGSGSSCVSKEAKPAKIDSLIVRQLADCARPLKNVSIFAGFAGRRQAASRWAGLPSAGRQLVGAFSEMSSNFFQQTPPLRIHQGFRLAASRLGGQIERSFERENQFSVL